MYPQGENEEIDFADNRHSDPDFDHTNFSQIPSVPSDLISAKLPKKHKFYLGYHLEMIHPITSKSLEK